MTLREAYSEVKRKLVAAGKPDFDAVCLFEKHTGVKIHALPLCGGEPAPQNLKSLWADVARRANGEPLQYLLGKWEFMGLDFKVGPGVLIPRADTEILAQTVIDFLKKQTDAAGHSGMLELCAGTGCVSIAAARFVPECKAACLELSSTALCFLNENIVHNGVADRVRAIHGDMLSFEHVTGIAPIACENASRFGAMCISCGLFRAANPNLPEQIDVIVCNPPYIKSGDIAGLQTEVGFEPHMALDGGEDGLAFYRAADPWLALLKKGGMAAFEVGLGQAHDVAVILQAFGLKNIFIDRDYAGIERVVGGYRL